MNALKKFYLSLGTFQCILLLVAYLFLYFAKNDSLIIILFIYSLFLGFFMIENRSQRLLANNTSLIFVLFLFLYGIFNSVIQKVVNNSIDDDVYKATIIYAATLPSFLLGFVAKRQPSYSLSYENEINRADISKLYTNFLLVFLLVAILYKTFFFYSIDMLFNLSALGKSRFDYFMHVSQGDIVSGYIISGAFLYFIYYYKKFNKKTLIIVAILLVYYIALQLSAGNRREFMPMILGVFWIFATTKRLKFNFFWFILLLLGIFLFNFFGTIRSNIFRGEGSDLKSSFIETMISNEFVYPFITLSEEVKWSNQNYNYNYRYGETILVNSITIYIPRNLYPDKPVSLANEFIRKKYGSREVIGFAYTPVSEFFVNFGALGPAILYFFIGVFFSYILRKKSQILNFLFFTMILDFCRGEIATFSYQFIFVSVFLLILPKAARLLYK